MTGACQCTWNKYKKCGRSTLIYREQKYTTPGRPVLQICASEDSDIYSICIVLEISAIKQKTQQYVSLYVVDLRRSRAGIVASKTPLIQNSTPYRPLESQTGCSTVCCLNQLTLTDHINTVLVSVVSNRSIGYCVHLLLCHSRPTDFFAGGGEQPLPGSWRLCPGSPQLISRAPVMVCCY